MICPPVQCERFLARMTGRGVPHAYLTFEGEGHGFRRADTLIRALEAELSLYAQAFSIARPDIPVWSWTSDPDPLTRPSRLRPGPLTAGDAGLIPAVTGPTPGCANLARRRAPVNLAGCLGPRLSREGPRVALRHFSYQDGKEFTMLARASRKLHHPWLFPPTDAGSFAVYAPADRGPDEDRVSDL